MIITIFNKSNYIPYPATKLFLGHQGTNHPEIRS